MGACLIGVINRGVKSEDTVEIKYPCVKKDGYPGVFSSGMGFRLRMTERVHWC